MEHFCRVYDGVDGTKVVCGWEVPSEGATGL